MEQPVTVLFVITGLGLGGAERMLLKLVSGLSDRFRPVVVSLEDTVGNIAGEFTRLGIPVHCLKMRGVASVPGGLVALTRLIREIRPDVVNTWLYHADLIGGLCARLAGCRAVSWNIRNGTLSPATSARTTRAVLWLNARLSSLIPAEILCCSEDARRIHVALGYDAGRIEVIPNGFDLAQFRPDPEAAAELRQALDIPPDAPLIGKIARFDPQKDHLTFVEAAALLHRSRPDTRFLLAGEDCDAGNAELNRWIAGHGLGAAFRLVGTRKDVARLTAALDIATSTSIYGEAFPNVLGEAMACAVPCVATDIGDAALIIGDTGRVVPSRRPDAVAAAWLDLLSLPADRRRALGAAARERISAHFEIGAIRRRYEAAFDRLAGHPAAAASPAGSSGSPGSSGSSERPAERSADLAANPGDAMRQTPSA